MRLRAVLFAASVAVLAWPASASAHATLVRSVPADRAVLGSAPRAVRFVFDDTVEPAAGIKAVRNGGPSVLAGRPRVVGGRTLVVPLRRLGDGDYTVLWRVVSDDGHTIAGVVSFAVGAGRAPPAAALSVGNGRSALDVVSRWLFLAGLLVAGGSSLFRLLTRQGRLGVLLGGLVAVLLGGSGLLGHHADFSTRFGAAYGSATVLAALAASLTAIAVADARVAPAAWLLPLVLLPAPSLAGHALDPGRPVVEAPVDILHVAAAAFWTGGLLQLAFSLRGDNRMETVRRFSSVALWSVVLLSLTGVVRAITEVGAVSRTWTTGYGQLLIVKTALLVLLVVLGWINRARLLPRLSFASLRRSMRLELVLLAGLVVAVALLTDTRPGRDAAAAAAPKPAASSRPPLPARDAVVLGREDGKLAVALAAEPRRLRVTVLGQTGLGVRGLLVRIAGARALPCGPGCYERRVRARGSVPVAIGERTLVFTVPPRAPGAASLVARASRVFRGLRSVDYEERLASSPTARIVSDFTLERPDRVRYRIRGGSSGIVIGTRRWDRVAGGKWIPSPSTRLPQPAPIWGEPVTNAHVLARTRTALVVSFLNPSVPAWFTVQFDPRTLRPQQLDMTAVAHFMHHRYTAFNRPRSIFVPRR